ncbi:hypothetical protein [[Acholeplasma] multilocale]|uniref:hypothetical protein n=1 Tax=[Acholeplasma] multilocale TaxID=264638 RepID=UPI00047CCAFA|nr:hypothetical protein [[Acholeplasma] multilocale]
MKKNKLIIAVYETENKNFIYELELGIEETWHKLSRIEKDKVAKKIRKVYNEIINQHLKMQEEEMSTKQFETLVGMITNLKSELKQDIADLRREMNERFDILEKAVIKLNKKVFGIEALTIE